MGDPRKNAVSLNDIEVLLAELLKVVDLFLSAGTNKI